MNLTTVDVGLGGGSCLQVANRSHIQMMSYLIKTPDNSLVIIDGGNNNEEDGSHLLSMIQENGGTVSLWIITHAHNDHFGALQWILENDQFNGVTIENMCFTFPPMEWLKTIQGGGSYAPAMAFLSALEKNNIAVSPLIKGENIECGGMTFEVLNDCSNYASYPSVNDSTIVILAHFPANDILFLGDLGDAASHDLVATCPSEKLRKDIVQMAHHGQGGPKKWFYELIRPKICLYTAPDWLWINDIGQGEDSGPWTTKETRKWMDELQVEASYHHGMGDFLFV